MIRGGGGGGASLIFEKLRDSIGAIKLTQRANIYVWIFEVVDPFVPVWCPPKNVHQKYECQKMIHSHRPKRSVQTCAGHNFDLSLSIFQYLLMKPVSYDRLDICPK